MRLKLTVTQEVDLTPEQLGQFFGEMDDDSQTRFFVAAAAHLAKVNAIDNQGWYIGGHLRNCSCATEDARDFVRAIMNGIENSTHGKELVNG